VDREVHATAGREAGATVSCFAGHRSRWGADRKTNLSPGPLCREISGASSLENHFAICELYLDNFAFCEQNQSEAFVHVISRKRLLEAATRQADLFAPLDAWYRIAKRAEWRSLENVREVFPSADGVGKYTVFNIKGNTFRLIVEINYKTGRIYIRHVLTHAAYDKGGWKS